MRRFRLARRVPQVRLRDALHTSAFVVLPPHVSRLPPSPTLLTTFATSLGRVSARLLPRTEALADKSTFRPTPDACHAADVSRLDTRLGA